MFRPVLRLLPLFIASASVLCQNLVLTNDDGWAVAQIRAQNDALKDAGFNVVLSAPAENKSGTGSSTTTPTTLTEPCEFETCPTGSPPEGSEADDPRINYVNAFPVDAVRFGIQTLAPEFFGGPPEFVVSGPNVGIVEISGTVGAACEAAKEGIPSTAFSGASTSQDSFTTLTTDPDSTDTIASLIYAQLTTTFTQAMLASSARPILPANTTVNVNFPSVLNCGDADNYSFIFTRLVSDPSATDVETCGTDHLPVETDVINEGCFVTVSVIGANTKADVDAETQGAVLNRISSILSCLPSS
ncbi:hypothetical protein EIP86_002431 [Pleurotus ostreatoroseus]|nr:hypothetical protein EIP86_002431 [Pleurotus ostreatoroseus]